MRIQNPLSCSAVIVAMVALATNISSSHAEDVLIKAKRVVTVTGETYEPGAVLVSDGKITAVGASIDAGAAETIEVHTVMPGLINAYGQAGISGQETERTREVTPRLSTVDVIDLQDREFTEQLADGVTTINVCPGTDNVISGLSCAIKTTGDSAARIVASNTGLVIANCSDPASRNSSRSRPDSIYIRQPTNRMGVVWILRSTFHRAKTGANQTENDGILRKALDGEQPILAVSRTHYDISSLLTIGDELGFKAIVVGGEESWKILDTLKATKTQIILGSTRPGSQIGSERTRVTGNNASQLHQAGIEFCLSGDALLDQARFAVRFGLDQDEALKSITSSPAKILKIDDKVGSIEVGKHADLVAFNGDPLEFTSSVQWVMVNGKTTKFDITSDTKKTSDK